MGRLSRRVAARVGRSAVIL